MNNGRLPPTRGNAPGKKPHTVALMSLWTDEQAKALPLVGASALDVLYMAVTCCVSLQAFPSRERAAHVACYHVHLNLAADWCSKDRRLG